MSVDHPSDGTLTWGLPAAKCFLYTIHDCCSKSIHISPDFNNCTIRSFETIKLPSNNNIYITVVRLFEYRSMFLNLFESASLPTCKREIFCTWSKKRHFSVAIVPLRHLARGDGLDGVPTAVIEMVP